MTKNKTNYEDMPEYNEGYDAYWEHGIDWRKNPYGEDQPQRTAWTYGYQDAYDYLQHERHEELEDGWNSKMAGDPYGNPHDPNDESRYLRNLHDAYDIGYRQATAWLEGQAAAKEGKELVNPYPENDDNVYLSYEDGYRHYLHEKETEDA